MLSEIRKARTLLTDLFAGTLHNLSSAYLP